MLDSFHPNLLALLAAVGIAVARTLYRGALLRLGAGTTALVSGTITLASAWGFYFYTGAVERWPLPGVVWFVVVGVLGGLGSRYLSFFALKTVGLARTSVLMQTSLIWSSGLAIVLLGERLTLPIAAGTLAIMIGSILLVGKADEKLKGIPTAYYLIPLAAAMFQGLSHLFRKFGFAWITSAPLGMGISSTVATLCLLALMPFAKESPPSSWERHPLLLIVAGGVFNAQAALFFWTAVQRGDLVQVIPINRLSVLLMIFASWLFFRKHETVTSRVVIGGLLAVVGAFSVIWGN